MKEAGDAIQDKFAQAKDKVTNDDGAKVEVEVKKQ
jgi:hypothetical protein